MILTKTGYCLTDLKNNMTFSEFARVNSVSYRQSYLIIMFLEKQGYITRRDLKRRGKVITLTPKGVTLKELICKIITNHKLNYLDDKVLKGVE